MYLCRPRLFNIESSKDILVENWFFLNSPYWTFWVHDVDGLEVRFCDIRCVSKYAIFGDAGLGRDLYPQREEDGAGPPQHHRPHRLQHRRLRRVGPQCVDTRLQRLEPGRLHCCEGIALRYVYPFLISLVVRITQRTCCLRG